MSKHTTHLKQSVTQETLPRKINLSYTFYYINSKQIVNDSIW